MTIKEYNEAELKAHLKGCYEMVKKQRKASQVAAWADVHVDTVIRYLCNTGKRDTIANHTLAYQIILLSYRACGASVPETVKNCYTEKAI